MTTQLFDNRTIFKFLAYQRLTIGCDSQQRSVHEIGMSLSRIFHRLLITMEKPPAEYPIQGNRYHGEKKQCEGPRPGPLRGSYRHQRVSNAGKRQYLCNEKQDRAELSPFFQVMPHPFSFPSSDAESNPNLN